jgi:hypothetical protein
MVVLAFVNRIALVAAAVIEVRDSLRACVRRPVVRPIMRPIGRSNRFGDIRRRIPVGEYVVFAASADADTRIVEVRPPRPDRPAIPRAGTFLTHQITVRAPLDRRVDLVASDREVGEHVKPTRLDVEERPRRCACPPALKNGYRTWTPRGYEESTSLNVRMCPFDGWRLPSPNPAPDSNQQSEMTMLPSFRKPGEPARPERGAASISIWMPAACR